MARPSTTGGRKRSPLSSVAKQTTLTQLQFARYSPTVSFPSEDGPSRQQMGDEVPLDPRPAKRRKLQGLAYERPALSKAAEQAILHRPRAVDGIHGLPSPPLSSDKPRMDPCPVQSLSKTTPTPMSTPAACSLTAKGVLPKIHPQIPSPERSPLREISGNTPSHLVSLSSTPEKETVLTRLSPTAFSPALGEEVPSNQRARRKSCTVRSTQPNLQQSHIVNKALQSSYKVPKPKVTVEYDGPAGGVQPGALTGPLSHESTEMTALSKGNKRGIEPPHLPAFKGPRLPNPPLPTSLHARKYVAPYLRRRTDGVNSTDCAANRPYRASEVERSFGDDMLLWTQEAASHDNGSQTPLTKGRRQTPRSQARFQVYEDPPCCTLPPFEPSGSQTEGEEQSSQCTPTRSRMKPELTVQTPLRVQRVLYKADTASGNRATEASHISKISPLLPEASPTQRPTWTQADWKSTSRSFGDDLSLPSSSTGSASQGSPVSRTPKATRSGTQLRHLSSTFMSSTQDVTLGAAERADMQLHADMLESLVEIPRPVTPEAKRKILIEIVSSPLVVREIPESPNASS